MAIDSYSLCPGGRGKKIRFCCPDHLKDLEQIDQMIEGEQFAAGLSFVESLEKKRPNCACLSEAKCLFQKAIGLWEEAYQTATNFVAREPKNVVALTELASCAALLDKPQEAISALVDAIENVEGDQFPLAVVQAMLTVGTSLFEHGRIFQAIAVAKQLQAFAPQDQASNAFLYRCLGSDSVPLMLKEQVFDLEAPVDFPKKAEYDQAVALLARGSWKRGRAILETLLEFGDAWSNLFRNLAIVEYWFAEEEKGRAYFDRYLASPDADYEASVDVEQFLLLLEAPSWDDVEYMTRRVYTLEDFDASYEKFLSSKSLVANRRLQATGAGDVPPKMAFNVLDRPLEDLASEPKLNDVASLSGYLFLYGKQTSRGARAEFYLFPDAIGRADSLLQETLGFTPALETTETLEGRPTLWTTNASTPRFQFKDPSKLNEEAATNLFDEAFEAFADRWFAHAYRVLGGKSPKEYLEEPNGARRVDALIRIVSSIFTAPYNEKVAGLLRSRAGLNAPAPIVPPTTFASTEEAVEFFRNVPLWRWGRLQVESCSSDALAELLQIANLVAPRDVKAKFAAEFVKRPVGEVKYEDRAVAFGVLIDEALLSQDSDQALSLIAEAGKYANENGQSDSRWNVLEIMTRFRRQEFEQVRAIAKHVFAEHQEDQEAIQTLQQFFAELNASAQAQMQAAEAYRLRAGQAAPTPVRPQTKQNAQTTTVDFAVGSGAGVSKETKSSGGGLWTPGGSTETQSQNGGGSKLWIPD